MLGGDELRKLRNEVCYSQEYMAKQLGIAQSTYQRIEAGEIKISVERLLRISDIFNEPLKNSDKTKSNDSILEELKHLRKLVLNQEKYILELEEILKSKQI